MPDDVGLIAGYYRLEAGAPALELPGGMRGFPVTDKRNAALRLMAVQTRNDLPARPRITLAHAGLPVPNAILPVDYGSGRDPAGQPGWWIVSQALPGPALGLRPQGWREGELVACVLQPVAEALVGLQARGLTHRAINPGNLFRANVREKVTLGPFWACPPASQQPPLYEPPYAARCVANGRGDGSIADDIYALGVTLLALFGGKLPLAELDPAASLQRRIEMGNFSAMTADAPLTPLLADLLRSMLAEDPEHRPSPALLLKPEQARARRVAARPPRRAQVALNVGGQDVWSARELAHAMGLQPEPAYRLLRSGEVERWLRRCLGDPPLGMRVEDVTRHTEEELTDETRRLHMLVMRAVAAIDPLAPLVWRGFALLPDGLGTALAGAGRELGTALEEVVLTDAVAAYLAVHERRHTALVLIDEQRPFRRWLERPGPAGGVRCLLYGANPMMACASPLLGGLPVVRLAELLPALEAVSAAADRSRPPIDLDIAAFLAVRADAPLSAGLRRVASFAGRAERLTVLRLFGAIQERFQPGWLPGLASWLVACDFAGVSGWHSQTRRKALQEEVAKAAARGDVAELARLMDDPAAHMADKEGMETAKARIAALSDELAAIAAGGPRRAAMAERLSHEVMTGLGLIACLGAILSLALRW